MKLVALAVIFSGWVIAMSGLFVTSSEFGRLLFALAGIGVSLFGIFGILNQCFLKEAIWKK